jgi:hypothetical protein
MGVAMDGLMVHIRQEGWKELKAGAVFELESSGFAFRREPPAGQLVLRQPAPGRYRQVVQGRGHTRFSA